MLDLIRQASANIKGVLFPTPLIHSSYFSGLLGARVYLKLENLQKTGSFKSRGAYNKILSLSEKEKEAGVITASSGNHAQGVAWASALLGVRSTIIMPVSTPITKYVAARGYGAAVEHHGATFAEAYSRALAVAEQKGLVFIPPFDDELVIAGQGTIGLEVLEELENVDAVVVPVGGGGLISGIASAIKEVKPSVKVYGVEASASASCVASFKEGRPVAVESRPTMADGIAVKCIGGKTWPIIREHVDHVVDVDEDAIAAAVLKILERKKLVVEGAGAVGVAAAMEGRITAEGNTVFVLSGGNIDVTTLDRVIRLGLLREGRIARFSVVLGDEPGSLARLAKEIASHRANILHVAHQRDAMDLPIGRVRIEVIAEVEDGAHGAALVKALEDRGYEVTV